MSNVTTALPADYEYVHHPSHYNVHPSQVECIEIVEWLPFNTGNAFKYLYRRGQKGSLVQDLEKALWYTKREIERIDSCIELSVSGRPVFSLSPRIEMLIERVLNAERSVPDGIPDVYGALALPQTRSSYLRSLELAATQIGEMIGAAKLTSK